ncbi:Integrin alpha-8 [Acropora cervicornis]|uniref:Integrin alpha-8 n=1 Tax=Acropora cervicornis TaxID=6130 RepID=A0AAD9QZP3_ACRCE|nr:Integrin alpha-8 [Acropora cervicornis]
MTAHYRLVYFVLLTFSHCLVLFSFNLDDKHSLVYSGSPGEYFGYALTLHAQNNGENWVVVGAPLGNKTSPSNERNRFGSVYRCRSGAPSCEVIEIDDSGKQVDIEEKTGQWLGATVASVTRKSSAGAYGDVLVCAPRYSLWGEVVDKPENRDRQLLGKCFVIRNDLSSTHDGKNWNYESKRDGTCQAGISGATSNVGSTQIFLMGMTGRYLVNGSIALYYSDDIRAPYKTPSAKQFADAAGDMTGMAMGYAVAIGRFSSPDTDELVASSIRAAQLKGKVVAFYHASRGLEVRFTLPLPQDVQAGSNFGHSLCAVDLNNDRYSDLLISAPYHGQDEGRVYVYINDGNTPGTLNQVPAMTLEGPKSKRGLFGFAMAVAGDLNQDSYPASKVSPGVITFGYSLAGNLDVDNNGYPDLAIGAYSSDKVFLFRSRSIVIMEANITLSNTQIPLEDSDGAMQIASDGVSRLSVNLRSQNVTYSIELDKSRSQEVLRRMFFLHENKTTFRTTQQVSLPKEDEWYCDFRHTVYLREKEEIQSVNDPLTFDLIYDLAQFSSCELCPILNDYNDIIQRSFTAEAFFVKQCGRDKICEPDLSVKGHVRFGLDDSEDHKELHVGTDKEMTVEVVVENKAQDSAYPGKVIVSYPSVMDYTTSNQGVSCSKMTTAKNVFASSSLVDISKLECVKQFDIRFNVHKVTGNISTVEITLEATSPDKELNANDNKVKLVIPVKFEADLSIRGPDQVVYNDKVSEVKDIIGIGPAVKNILTILRNAGTCNIEVDPLNLQPCPSDNSITCLKIPCYLGRMKKGDDVQIQMAHRLWQNTLIKSKAGSIELITTAEIVRSSVPESGKGNNSVEITLKASPKTKPSTKRKTAVWIYVVSAVGALALLAIVVLALYKCGFFKRKDLSSGNTEEEMTPMRTPAPGTVA